MNTAGSAHPLSGLFLTPGLHMPSHMMDPKALDYFARYDYESWKPPQVRKDWITSWVGSGEFLDIGCGGYPVSMDVAGGTERGVGADISLNAVERFRTYFKEFFFLDIENAKPSDVPQLQKRFSSVIMSETLEHFSDPAQVLGTVKSFLAPGGRLLITYPNAFSIAQGIDWLLHRGTWKRFSDFHDSHVYLVRKRELEALFATLGFSVVHFDLRASDIAAGFPNEKNSLWRRVAAAWPSLFGHQFFYVLEASGGVGHQL